MGVNLDDILGNKDQEILVDKTKRNVNYLMIGAAVVVVLIVIIAIVMLGRTNTNNAIERARAIARDAERISSVVKDRYAEARSTGNDTLIIGEAQEKLSPDQIRSITVNGKKLSFKYGYYYLTVDQVRQLVPTLEVGAPYIVKYSTGETICLSGVPYNGKTYYEVADLKAIAAGQTPPSDYTVVVNNAEDMKLFASYPYATFRLNADVDMSAFNNGNGWTPVPTFTGTFDGRGYKISNLRINNSSLNYAGLFGTISAEGWVSNLVLENIDVAGGDYVGAVAGSCSGTISNCTVSGRVASTGRYVGGLFGNFEGTASNVTSIVSVNGSQFVGGFAGQITGGNVTQCKVKGRSSSDIRVSGRQDCVGGFVGEVAANRDLTIDQVCAVATVTGDAKVGGLVGRINSLDSIYTITISNC